MRATTLLVALGVISSLHCGDALHATSAWDRIRPRRRPAAPTSGSVAQNEPGSKIPGSTIAFAHRRSTSDASSAAAVASIYSKNTLSQQQRRQESLNAGHNPLLSLNLNLDALARAQAPERAQELYQRIAALHREGYYAVSPDIVSFNSVLKAWQTDPVKALEFWEAEAVQGRMNVRSYNTFLLALAKAGMHDQAESLLRQMQAVNAAVRPDRISWNTVILACATAVSVDDIDDSSANIITEKAERLLNEMIHGADVNTSFDELSSSDSNGSNAGSSKSRHRDFMTLPPVMDPNYVPPPPDATSYNTLIAAWAAHPDPLMAAQKAQEWLRVMQQSATGAGDQGNQGTPIVHPDVYTYTIVLKAWSRRGGPEAAQRALDLLEEMRQPGSHAQPNRITYTCVMRTLCHNGQPDQANIILQSMLEATPDLRPDCVAFTVLFDGWAAFAKDRAMDKDEAACRQAVQSARALLRQMKELSTTQKWPDTSPNERTYTSLLKTLAASQLFESTQLALDVLADMWNSNNGKTSPAATCRPTTIHYNAALDCCARSPRATKAVDASLLWHDMMKRNVPCDTITYNSILNAAANSFGSWDLKQTSMQIGIQAFDAMQEDDSCQPTSLTYNYYFKMIRRLQPSSASSSAVDTMALYQKGFDFCCAQGCLNEILVRQLTKSLTPKEWRSLLRKQHSAQGTVVADLPLEWSRNAMGTLRQPG